MKTNKILGILAILGFFSSASFAEDFLAKLTNGAVSDTSEGVRVLSAEEEREVVGGVYTHIKSMDSRISNYGVPMRYTVYGQIDLFGKEVNQKNPIEVLNFKRDTYDQGRYLGLDKKYHFAVQSDTIGVTWGQVSSIYVQSNYNYSKSVSWNNRYTYNVFYTLEGSNKLYQAYTKKSRNLANFYQFRAKHTLDSRRF
ncbi:hypothetical protein [Helicobacter rodentium]|uniref:hypothetical protein n=1 Tax=Helicobacter rodentium TaxID=59617 RepID=UPI0005508EE9|nr:hypothetical protein [Helicobacter rodentium]